MAVTRIAILAEGGFGEHDAKTATGVLRYSPHDVVAVIDSTRAGTRVRDHIAGLDLDVPIVAGIEEALPLEPTILLIGIAPAGGKLPAAWRETIHRAIDAGLGIESGLHDFLGDDPELAAAAEARGVEIRDLRRAPAGLNVPTGENLTVDAHVVATVGSDCSLGKMTVCLELDRAARGRGLPSAFVPTGQTGIAIAGWGIAVDEVVSDYVAGASEQLLLEGRRRAGPGALLWIEGQGSISHPSYSGVTLGLLHGSAPHALILVHEPGRTHLDMPDGPPIPPLPQLIEDYERMARYVRAARVVAVSLKTNRLTPDEAAAAISATEHETGLPADDPVRNGGGKLLDAVLAAR
jgi:D-glutamate N-acetyltransferase